MIIWVFAHNHPTLLKRSVAQVSMYKTHAPKASILVNGYHPIHQEFEEFLVRHNGFEAALVCGSGFLANFSLIEALPRKKDLLILDEEYHASGIIASKTVDAEVLMFRHNDANHLESLINTHNHNRIIIAVEGIYSMSGDLLNREIFDVADRYNALLIVDEAHSVGVVGENLRGVFDLLVLPQKRIISKWEHSVKRWAVMARIFYVLSILQSFYKTVLKRLSIPQPLHSLILL